MSEIAVIVPVFKTEKYLRRCVDSILNQTFTDFSLILVDDGSPDNCPQICDEYRQIDRRISVIHQANQGVAAARNAGLDSAMQMQVQWIAYIDSDDWIHQGYLEVLYNEVCRSGNLISACGRKWVTQQEPDESTSVLTFHNMDMDTAFYENYFACNGFPCKLFHISLFADTRCPVGRLYEDVFVTYKLLLKAGMISVTSFPMYFYFQHPDGITRSQWTPKRLDQIEAHEKRLRFLKEGNFSKAYIRCLVAYIWVLSDQTQGIKKYCKDYPTPKNRQTYHWIKKRFVQLFKKSQEYGLFPLNDANWELYRQANYSYFYLKIRYFLQRNKK